MALDFSFRTWKTFPAAPTPPPLVIVGPQGPPGIPGPTGPPGQDALGKQTEIDFGAIPVSEAEFTVVDAEVTPASIISGSAAYAAPDGKMLDEIQMDSLSLVFGAGNGSFEIFVKALSGDVSGKFKINYLIS